MSSKEDIKVELVSYKPTDEEKLVIRSALYNFITLATVGAASLGMSARLWAKSRTTPLKPRTAIPTILGTFAGLAFGGALGMDRGMHRLRESLPRDSHLLTIIHENDKLKQQQQETLFSGPIDEESTDSVQNLITLDESLPQQQSEMDEPQLLLGDGKE